MEAISRISVQLPISMTAPAMARRLVRNTCHGLPEELSHIAALLTSEVVTASLLHGRLDPERPAGAISLRVRRNATTLRVEVHDRAGEPTVGLGQAILASLAAEWGSTWRPSAGTVVWFVLDSRPAPAGNPDDRHVAAPSVPCNRRRPVRNRPVPPRLPRQRTSSWPRS